MKQKVGEEKKDAIDVEVEKKLTTGSSHKLSIHPNLSTWFLYGKLIIDGTFIYISLI